MYRTVATLLAIMLVMSTHAKKLPSQFKQCKRDDPEVDKCLAEAVEKAVVAMKDGIPSHHVLPSDPLSVSKITIEESKNRPVNINLVLTDALLHGLKDVKVTKVKSDLDHKEAWLDAFVKQLILDGDYVMDGKFLVLPLKGKGKVTATLDDLVVKIHIKADSKTKNGQVHWDLKTFDLEVTETKKLATKFENLFDGDQTLAKPTQESLNENWKELWASLKPAMENVFATVLKRAASSILEQVPEKDMFL